MFGLTVLFWMACLLMVVVANRSACRHRKRAEAYRKQIEELQIERSDLLVALSRAKRESTFLEIQGTVIPFGSDKQKALIDMIAKSIEMETKGIGVSHEGECVGAFMWNKRK